jgi:predicted dehydrogenase
MPEPFRWGILGAARINLRFVPGLRTTNHQIAIIGSRDPAKGQAAAAQFGAERVGSYDDVLNARDVDAIYIPLPNSLHVPWAMRAAEAGKHVLCEKPLAPSIEECATMVAAAERHGTHLVEAFMYRYHPQWQLVWDTIRSGRIGTVQMLRASFQFGQRDPNNVRLRPELGGGVLQDAGCYCINVARWFLGEPTRVHGIALDRQGSGVDTHCAAALEFASGALAALSCSFETERVQTVEISGERGRIDVLTPFVAADQAQVRILDASGERIETLPSANAYGLECLAMERLVREGAPVLTPATDAAKTQAVIAAWKAAK